MQRPTVEDINEYLSKRKAEFDDLKAGWMSPDGTFYETYCYEHSEFARKMYAYLSEDANDKAVNNAQSELISKFHWVSIHRADIMFGGKYTVNFAKELTQEQKRVLKPVIEDNVEYIDNWGKYELLYALEIEEAGKDYR